MNLGRLGLLFRGESSLSSTLSSFGYQVLFVNQLIPEVVEETDAKEEVDKTIE